MVIGRWVGRTGGGCHLEYEAQSTVFRPRQSSLDLMKANEGIRIRCDERILLKFRIRKEKSEAEIRSQTEIVVHSSMMIPRGQK